MAAVYIYAIDIYIIKSCVLVDFKISLIFQNTLPMFNTSFKTTVSFNVNIWKVVFIGKYENKNI